MAAVAVVLVGIAGAGAGWLNGDAAVYAASARDGAIFERPVHAGYVAVAGGLASLVGAALPAWLDRLTAVCAGLAVASARDPREAWITAALVLPWCAFGEVDLPWIALVCWALRGSERWAAGAVGLAVAMSPTALLAVPWVLVGRRGGGAVVGAGLAVAALTVASGGGWWWGPRGVLTTTLLPGRTLGAWLVALPWCVLPLVRGSPRGLFACVPLLLSPPDVPAWIVAGRALPLRAHWAAPWLIGTQLLVGALQLEARHRQVRAEDAVVRMVAEALEPGDGLIAPWSWGARIGVAATGDPYGPVWRSADRAVRDQAERWCRFRPERVIVVEGGTARREPGAPWHDGFGCPR